MTKQPHYLEVLAAELEAIDLKQKELWRERKEALIWYKQLGKGNYELKQLTGMDISNISRITKGVPINLDAPQPPLLVARIERAKAERANPSSTPVVKEKEPEKLPYYMGQTKDETIALIMRVNPDVTKEIAEAWYECDKPRDEYEHQGTANWHKNQKELSDEFDRKEGFTSLTDEEAAIVSDIRTSPEKLAEIESARMMRHMMGD